MEEKNGAVVLSSGGQDSTTCLAWARMEWGVENIMALSFDYGQRHRGELECSRLICEKWGIKHTVVDLKNILNFPTSYLTNPVADEIYLRDDGLPSTFVPGRNMLFLTVAFLHADYLGYKNIVIGANEIDYSGYPDCREEFMVMMERGVNLAIGAPPATIKIHTPLLHRNKAEIWRLADMLGVVHTIRYETTTCYNGMIGGGCGKCPACKLREDGYQQYLSGVKR